MKHKKKTKANKASLYEMMKKGGKLYKKGGVNDPTRKAERRKALMNELRIANDPKTNYGSEQARAKDVATIQAKIKALG